ncbi:restriction endonuclease subunit S [Candidatus Chloroploca sp. M-50]|uniref:Restriction endonuclease subunit S n=1 Tax=Candidatus Chloroploca mongolica TaxID=2528176 RepID=A0ABS4DDB9_9CHLR|nr:restriction endonuclease subunit S [Candidatus Chloroploca mongolica]MBP1467324.1 restriction endonuclease subunit S [Candidatus Chloroploca mongolica]
MNTDLLLTHYQRIADAPDAVARLRRFILDLAVRGKLVPQDPSDEPAGELLKRITAEKARLVEAGLARKPKGYPSLAEEDIPYPLPTKWAWSQIAEIGILSPRNEAPDDTEASFVPMPMVPAEYGAANKHEVRLWGDIKRGYTHFADGDVGLAKITPCFENGKSTVFRNLMGGFGSGTTELHIVRPLFVNPDYILIHLKSPQFIDTGIPKMTGTAGQKRVSGEYFASSPFPLPPLAEQRRIVAKVDELMALCDALEAERAAREATRDRLAAASLARLHRPDPDPLRFRADAAFALEHLAALSARADQVPALRRVILDLAVRGKLVPQDPSDEPAGELLKRLAKAKTLCFKAEGLRERSPVQPLTRDTVPFEYPDCWEIPSFDDVFVIVSGVTKGQKLPPDDRIEVPYLRVANVQRGFLDLSVVKTITVKRGDAIRFRLKYGDILMTEGGDWDKLGRTAVWDGEVSHCIHQNHVFRVRPPSEEINPRWVMIYTNSINGRAYFEDAAKQTTNLASINMTQLRGCPLPLPPLAEQHRIVAKVDELMALCDALEARLGAAEATRGRLLEALLHTAVAPEEPGPVADRRE